MRRVLAVLLGCLPLIASAQSVDFVSKGEPLKYALERLSETTGQKLTVHSDLSSEIVVIDVTDRETNELLDKIAEVVHAEWKRTTTGGLRLERSKKTQRELERQSLDAHAKKIKEYLDSCDEVLNQPFDTAFATNLQKRLVNLMSRDVESPSDFANREQLMAEYEKGPAARLTIRLLKTIDPKHLVGLQSGERRVFNLTPSRLQYGFGKGAKEAFDKFVQEQNIWAAVSTGQRQRSMMSASPMSHQKPVAHPPVEWSLEIVDTNSTSPVGANLFGLDENGSKNFLYQVTITSPEVEAFVPYRSTEFETPDWLTGLPRELFEGTSALFGGKPVELSDEAREFVSKPTAGDPGARLAHAVLSKRFESSDLVALLPDGDSYRMVYMVALVDDHKSFDSLLDRGINWTVTTKDGWAIIEPKDVFNAWNRRTPREVFEKFLTNYIKKGRATFEDYSTFVAELRWESLIEGMHTRLLGLPINRLSGGRLNWQLLRLYGRLVQQQKTILTQGGSLGYYNLTSDQREPYLLATIAQEIRSPEWKEFGGDMYWVSQGDVLEPTEALANGVPRSATLQITVKSKPNVYGYMKTESGFEPFAGMEPRTVAYYIKRLRDPSQLYPGERVYDAWAMGEQRTYMFRLQFTEDRWHVFEIREDVSDADAKPGAWESLPKNVVEEIRKEIDKG